MAYDGVLALLLLALGSPVLVAVNSRGKIMYVVLYSMIFSDVQDWSCGVVVITCR